MILTHKVKHGRDFSKELALAKKVADFAIEHRKTSSKYVSHLGLKSAISNQILRKYANNPKARTVKSVKLTIPAQGIKTTNKKKSLFVSCVKLNLLITFDSSFQKINQVELDETYAYISCTYKEPSQYKSKTIIGVDRNTTGHVLVASNINTGKVLKLGKECNHTHVKYKNIRKILQKKGKFGVLKKIKSRESRIIRNTNHQISKRLIIEAKDIKAVLVLEDLKDIRTTAKRRKKDQKAS